MEIRELEVQERFKTGKGIARKLRAGGRIPAICYRKGTAPIQLSLDPKRLEKLLHTTAGQNVLIQLQIQGAEIRKKTVILKDLQRHPLSGMLHVDFLEVLLDEAIVVEVPLRLVGEPLEALREGGLVQQLRRTIEVQCLPTRIPDQITVDVSALKLGDSIRVEEIRIDEDIRILTGPKEPVVVISAAAAEEEKAEAVAAEPGEEAAGAETTGEGSQGKES
jgi:large subunit ribosomal protein L25